MGLSTISARRVGLSFLPPLLAIAAAIAVAAAPLRTSGQSATPEAASDGFVGSWRLTFETPLGPSQSLLTVMADGTAVFSGRPVRPANEGAPVTFVSAGHGVWQPTGPGTADITWVGFVSDAQGNFLAVATDSAQATLSADGSSWHGAYSATVADPGGNVIFVGDGRVEAVRITPQSLATPATGTPGAQQG